MVKTNTDAAGEKNQGRSDHDTSAETKKLSRKLRGGISVAIDDGAYVIHQGIPGGQFDAGFMEEAMYMASSTLLLGRQHDPLLSIPDFDYRADTHPIVKEEGPMLFRRATEGGENAVTALVVRSGTGTLRAMQGKHAHEEVLAPGDIALIHASEEDTWFGIENDEPFEFTVVRSSIGRGTDQAAFDYSAGALRRAAVAVARDEEGKAALARYELLLAQKKDKAPFADRLSKSAKNLLGW